MSGRRTRDVAGLILGIVVLAGTAVVARGGVTETEQRVFRSANELPDGAFRAVWAPMQYGTFGAIPALAALALLRRLPRLGTAIAVGGIGAWVLAKIVKPLVGRGRPIAELNDARTRGQEEGDLGFPSGHAAVSAALTVVSWPYLSPRARVACSALSCFVPVARLYVGAHLPLDALGGSALGLSVGCLTDLATRSPG